MTWSRRPQDGAGDGNGKPSRSAYDKALALLVRREHSRRELRARLLRDGYPVDEADAALERLREERLQDDGRYAEALVRARVARGYGPGRLRVELRAQGFSDAAIGQRLAALDVDWLALASAELRRHHGPVVDARDPRERLRRAQFLLRRGFAAATVRAVTHADLDATVDPDS